MKNDMINDNLLKLYCNINKDSITPLLKILVSYIKPSFLFKSDVLVPIHLGRDVATEKSKDGEVAESDLQWLYQHCIGDNDFAESISKVNRSVGFLTGTYWAWKNYEKLGDPEYFGSFGYRRFFIPNFLNKLYQFDLILPKKDFQQPNLKTFFINSHGKQACDVMYEVVQAYYPDMFYLWEKYMNLNAGYMFEIYVLRKKYFFEFCNWIFPLLFEILKVNPSSFIPRGTEKDKIIRFFAENKWESLCNYHNFDLYQMRNVGFMMERLTGFYFYVLSNRCRWFEENVIQLSSPTREQVLNILKLTMKVFHG